MLVLKEMFLSLYKDHAGPHLVNIFSSKSVHIFFSFFIENIEKLPILVFRYTFIHAKNSFRAGILIVLIV